jgi:hypothetical protein
MIDQRMKTRLTFLFLLLLCGFDDLPLRAENAPDGTLLGVLNGFDVLDRPITEPVLRGKTLLISVSNQETADAAIEWQAQVGVEAMLPLGGKNEDKLLHLAVADVSSYPRLLRPIVKQRLKSIHEKMHRRLRARFAQKSQSPPADLQDRVYLLPDWTGALMEILMAGGTQK